MIRSKKITLALAGLSVAALALAGCSTKADGNGNGNTNPGDNGDNGNTVTTGAGINGTTINIGVALDLTGPFAVLSTDHNRGVELYWEEKNADGGVGGVYDVTLDVKDHGYNVQNAVTVYQELAPNVLAFQDFVGGSHTAAVLPDAEADSRLLLPSSATHLLAESSSIMLVNALYDMDMEIVFEWLVEQGEISSGDTVANIYGEGDYGEESHAGVLAAAERHGVTVESYLVKPTDTDMTAPVTDALAKGATAMLASTTPGQTASIATVLQTADADIAIGGSWPSYAPGLLDTGAADYLIEHFVAAAYVTTFDTPAGSALFESLTEKFPGETITNQAAMGYAAAYVLDSVLEAAYAAGDLTPEGVIEARTSIGTINSDGLFPPLSFGELGQSPTNAGYMVAFDPNVDGKLKTISDGLFGVN